MPASLLSLILLAAPAGAWDGFDAGQPAEPTLLGSDAWHFSKRIDAVAADPKGRRAAVTSGLQVFVVDLNTGEHLGVHDAPCAPIDAIAWAPGGALVAGCNTAGGSAPRLLYWEARWREPVFVGNTPGPVTAVAAIDNGGLVFAAGLEDGQVVLVEQGSGATIDAIELPGGRVRTLRPSPDLRRLAAVTASAARIIDEGGALTLPLPAGEEARGVAWAGGEVAVGLRDAVAVYDPDAGVPSRRLARPGVHSGPAHVGVDEQGRLLAVWPQEAKARIYREAAGRWRALTPAPVHPEESVAFDASGTLLLTSGVHRDVLGVRRVKDGEMVSRGHLAAITEAALSPDGRKVASVDQAGGVQIWRIEDGEPLQRWQIAPPERHMFAHDDAAVAWTGASTLVAGSGSGGMFRLQKRGAPVEKREKRFVSQVRVDAKGRHGVVIWRSGKMEVRRMGARADRPLWTLHQKEGRGRRVTDAGISADGRLVYAVAGGEVILRAVKTGALKWRRPASVAAISADGRRLAVVHAGELVMYATATGQALVRFEVQPGFGAVTAMTVDSTGNWVALGGAGGVEVHRVSADGQPEVFATLGPEKVVWLAFSRDHLVARAQETPYLMVFRTGSSAQMLADQAADHFGH